MNQSFLQSLLLLVVVIFCLSFPVAILSAQEDSEKMVIESSPNRQSESGNLGGNGSVVVGEHRFDVVMYRANGVINNFGQIISLERLEYVNAHLYVVAFNYKLVTAIRRITFEVEGQIGKHEGIQKHWENNVMLIARISFLQDTLPFSFAFGNGLSYAWEKPVIEEEEKGQETNRLLNFFIVEADMGAPGVPGNPRLLFRIHHRSGIYGTYCPPTCGSNFIAYGIKFGF